MIKRIVTVLSAAVLIPMTFTSPAEAHVTVCDKSAAVPTEAYGRLNVSASVVCPPDGHETWVSVSVSVEEKAHWYSSYQQIYPTVNLVRVPTYGSYPGGGKRATTRATFHCPYGDPKTYRTVAFVKVGGPEGTRSYTITSSGARLC